jgi:hypothetical protein
MDLHRITDPVLLRIRTLLFSSVAFKKLSKLIFFFLKYRYLFIIYCRDIYISLH